MKVQEENNNADGAPKDVSVDTSSMALKYNNSSVVKERIIEKADFERIGVHDVDTTTWNEANNFVQDVSSWPVAAIEFVKGEANFQLITATKA